jgi:acetoin utilization protein AcuB
MDIEKMKIEELMSENIICVDMDEKLSVVRELFIEHKFHHLMVVSKNKELVAVVSERDYFKATNSNLELPSANKKDLDMLNKRVHQIISRKLVSIDESASFSAAIKKFHEENVSCIPVVNSSKKAVGIITWRDILTWLYDKTNIAAS